MLASKLTFTNVEIAEAIAILWLGTLVSIVAFFITVITGDLAEILPLPVITLAVLLLYFWGYICF